MNTSEIKKETVAIFGAGIAGLAVAHELSRLGYKVSVYESNADAGGFFRSARRDEDHNTPSEYSWHGFGPWYHNVYDIMKQIPFDDVSSVYDSVLSRPIDYHVVPDEVISVRGMLPVLETFRMTLFDGITWIWLLSKTWISNRRSTDRYALMNASDTWKPLMSDIGWKTWRSVFGPWIGSDWTRVSLHHVGLFFRKNIMSGSSHSHVSDEKGPAWTQGSWSGWLLLRGPSSEYWFDKWVKYLGTEGVKFYWEQALETLQYNSERITGATLVSGEVVKADYYILAVNPFASAEIIARTPALEELDQLHLFKNLIADGPHTQVSFQIAFSEKIEWSEDRFAIVLSDSEYDITLFAEEQVWDKGQDLGKNVKSLWTGTICAGTVPGGLYGIDVDHSTKEQFIAEITMQILRSKSLNARIKKANNGKELKDFPIERIQVWHEW
ncbi:MAG: NAD(P)-binding protein, partial [Candidatus Andersenbacteria bacterium]